MEMSGLHRGGIRGMETTDDEMSSGDIWAERWSMGILSVAFVPAERARRGLIRAMVFLAWSVPFVLVTCPVWLSLFVITILHDIAWKDHQ